MDSNLIPAQSENYARELASILFRRLRIVVVTMIVTITAAAGTAFFWPPLYGAYGSILVKGRKPPADGAGAASADMRGLPVAESDLYSELKILTSEDLYIQALAELERRNRIEALSALGDTPAKRIAALHKAVEARVVPTSNVIEVALAGAEPQTTLTLLETLFATYVRHRLTLWNSQSGEFLAAQSESLRLQIAEKTGQMNDYAQRMGLSSAGELMAANQSLQQELTASAARQAAAIAEIENEIRLLDGQQADGSAPHLSDQTAAQLAEQRERLEWAIAKREDLAGDIAALATENLQLRKAQQAYEIMKREVEALERSYQSSLQRQMESISVLVAPRLHERPVWPQPKLVLPAGMVAGVLLALSFAFLREFLDHSFARPEDVRRRLGVPVLFSIRDGAVEPALAARQPRLRHRSRSRG